jgi:translation initiation factor 2B subunit (eIF-2B alpha/beta/delta family)
VGLTDNRLFILVNKFDQKDRHGMDTDELRSYIVKNLFAGRLAKERIHPVSSKFGYLANRALFELSVAGILPDYKDNPWVEDFGKLALGACWESDISDAEEVEYRANKLWRNSLFDKPLTEVVYKGFENAALISLKSAVTKMLEYDRRVVECLQIRQTAINMDLRTVEKHIRSLDEDIRSIMETRDDARTRIDESIAALQLRIADLFTRCETAAKAEVHNIFSTQQSNNWVSRRLQGFIDLAPNRRTIELNFDADGYNDFETEAEARLFLNKVIEAVAAHIEPVLEEMQQATQDSVDEMTTGIWTSINRRLEKVLKAAAERLQETFPVALDFPKPRVRSVRVDFYELRQGAVQEDTVVKTATREERRWYTLWCRKHETSYQYREQVYRVYTLDIAKRLQQLLEEDHKQLRDMLDRFVQDEFSKAINIYFADIADYLERFRGDLVDSKRDQELEGDKLERLQAAMKTLYATAMAHGKNVQAVEAGLPGTEDSKPMFVLPQLSLAVGREPLAI